VHLVIDHARHQVTAGRIDDVRAGGGLDLTGNLDDALRLDQNVNVTNLTLVNQASVADE
jgi:hypothetical protein